MDACGSLNHFYRTVWNAALGAMVAVAEIAGSRGKSGNSASKARDGRNGNPTRLRFAQVAAAVALAWLSAPAALLANPTGGVAIQGQATFTTTGNKLLVTTQNGAGLNHSAINWQSFSIPTGSSTYFQQPSATSTSINRVVSNNPSQIFGSLGSNGNLVLVNQSGITVGAGAVVDTAGFTASALRMSDVDAMAGRLRFGDTTVPGNVSVLGNVLARNGDVVLLGAQVDTGSAALIQAPNGSTILGAGQQVEITGRGLEGIVMQVQAPTDSAVNLGTLKGDAVGIFAGTLKHSGLIQANTVSNEGGRVVLRAASQAETSGAVSASGASGGTVEIGVAHSADENQPGLLIHAAAIRANGSDGSGGVVRLSADTILSGAEISVDGSNVGGQVSVQARVRALATSAAHYSASSVLGNGGSILVSAKGSNYSSGAYLANGSLGGTVTLAGDEIKLAGTQVDVSGLNHGGAIHIGGLLHGAGGFSAQGYALANANAIYASSLSGFKANASQFGDAGQVSMWSDGTTRFNGRIEAKGGALGGNGGIAEISGVRGLAYNGLVDLSAQRGVAGTLLLDPHNIKVEAGSTGPSGTVDIPFLELIDPTPGAGEGFGGFAKLMMSNGEVVVASPLDGAGGANAGAVYFFNASGLLDATLIGAAPGDRIGSGGLQLLGNLNPDKLLVISPVWSGGGIDANAKGAVTWVNGATGALTSGALSGPQFVGTISSTNSVIGLNAGDRVGYNPYASAITVLNSGNFVIQSPMWGSAGVTTDAKGAVTWVNGSNGTLSDGVSTGGEVSSLNSLVGSSAGDSVGMIVNSFSKSSGVFAAGNNLMIVSNAWKNTDTGAVRAGAVTWMSGTTGQLHPEANGAPVFGGLVSSVNSLVGTATGDNVGASELSYSDAKGQINLNNGNYLVRSGMWGGGGTPANALGAVTWFGGAAGVVGPVSAANSIVGSIQGDLVGKGLVDASTNDPGVVVLPNGNYVVVSSRWDSGKGAVTWGNGATGSSGQIAAASQATAGIIPSVTGNAAGDFVGAHGIQIQNSGGSNYLIRSPWFDGGGALDPNGNLLTDSGALTWVNGANGTLNDSLSHGGVLSSANSLVGQFAYDNVGNVLALNSGNFLAKTPVWGSGLFGGANGIGALTWISGATGKLSDGTSLGGTVSAVNSVVGVSAGDNTTPNITELSGLATGKLIIHNPNFNNGGNVPKAGAITWMDGTNGHLSDGTTGGVISGGLTAPGNSLVGSTANDYIGAYFGYPEPNGSIKQLIDINGNGSGNLIVVTPAWDNAGQVNAGAITWMSGINGHLSNGASGGAISASNSLIGGTTGDAVGSAGVFPNDQTGNVVVQSNTWTNPNAPSTPITNAGAISWINGSNGHLVDGSAGSLVSATNSLVGTVVSGNLGGYNPVDVGNGKLVLRNPTWQGNRGASTWVSTATGTMSDGSTLIGEINSSNSIVGGTAGDQVGHTITPLPGGNYVVHSALGTSGALTWVAGASGLTHNGSNTISDLNSLRGSPGDAIDYTGANMVTNLANGNVVFSNPSWGGARGAVTWMNAATGQLGDGSYGGLVSSVNSLVGSSPNDGVGYLLVRQTVQNGVAKALANGGYVVGSPQWNNGIGAATLGNGSTGTVGVVSSANSLVGTDPGDAVSSGGIAVISNSAYLVSSPDWGSTGLSEQGLGAVTYVNTSQPKLGPVTPQNSLVGSLAGDQVGRGKIPASYTFNVGFDYRLQANGNLLISNPYWNGGTANGLSALTWMSGSTGKLSDGTFGGAVSAQNSLLGSTANDNLGDGKVVGLTNGNWVITSKSWGRGPNASIGKGAAIWMNGSTGQLSDLSFGGVVSASNSFVGNAIGDAVGGLDFCDCSVSGGITALSNGNYLVNSPSNNTQFGTLAWGNGNKGLIGTVGPSNSVTTLQQSVYEVGNTGKVLVGEGSGNSTNGAVYVLGIAGSTSSALNFLDTPDADLTLGAIWLANSLSTGTNLVLQANNDITVNSDISVTPITQSLGGNLTLQAGRSILLNANITTGNGNLTLIANETAAHGVVDAYRDSGLDSAKLSLAAGVSLNAGTGNVSFQLLDGAGNIGTISQGLGSSILASSLSVVSFGGADLSANNAVSSLQAYNTGTAGLTFNNFGNLTLGVTAGMGLTNSGGVIKVTTTGNLTLTTSPYGLVSSGATGDAIVLTTGGAFSAGGNALSAANGRWLVYAVDPRINNSTGISLNASDFKQYGYVAGASLAQTTGNGFIFSIAPSISVGLKGSISKTYDGTSTIALASSDFTVTPGQAFAGLGDTLTIAAMNGYFNSQYVGLATSVTASNVSLLPAVDTQSGARVYGYQIASPSTLLAQGAINPLTVNWTGNAGTSWSNARNWSGGFVPDGVNVITPSILTVSNAIYDLNGTTSVQTITATGNFELQSGTLNINGDLTTANYIQTGGTLSVSGALTVTNAFAQAAAGAIDKTGPVSINQAQGDLLVGNISGSSISLQASTGTITQQASTGLTGFLTVKTSGGANLMNPGNTLTGFAVSDVGLNVPSSGNINLLNHGALDLRGVKLSNGDLNIETQSPITVSSPVTASGNITLTAMTKDPNGTSNITINAPVTSTAGGITIQAYNNFIQNSGLNAALGIDVSTVAGSMFFGPGAFSVGNPVSYSVNGVPYIPPWIAASLSGGANDFVVTFLDQFLAVLDDPLATVDDPLGLRLRGQEGVVVEGEICKP